MPIPGYQTLMFPLLQLAGDGEVHSSAEAIEYVAEGIPDHTRRADAAPAQWTDAAP